MTTVKTNDIVKIVGVGGEYIIVCPVNNHLADVRSLDPAAMHRHGPIIHTVPVKKLRLLREARSTGYSF